MKRILDTFLAVAMLLSLVVACSENTSSVDVQDGPATGRTRALSIDVVRPAGIPVNVYLLGTAGNRTVVLDSVSLPYVNSKSVYSPDDDNRDTIVTFYNVPANGFSIIATAQDKHMERPYAFILTDKFIEAQSWMLDSAYVVKDSFAVNFYDMTAGLQLSAGTFDLALGDSICITGTLSCGVYDKAARKSGLIQIENIPASTLHPVAADYQQVEIIHGIRVYKDSVFWRVYSGRSQIANRNAVVDVLDEKNVELPMMNILDKLKDRTLDSMLIRYRRVRTSDDDIICAYGSLSNHIFMDSQHNIIPRSGHDQGRSDSITYWVTIPSIESTFKFLYTYGSVDLYSELQSSRARASAARVVSDNLTRLKDFSEDSSLAISFWIEADGKQGGEGERHSVLVAGDDTLGFEIAQCERESRFVCVTVVDRRDSASGGRELLGKVEVLDGKAHHVSFVIHKNLFVIALDGVTVHESEVELPQGLYGISDVNVGDYLLTDYVQYSFGDFIRKAGEKDWTRLKAWLEAFYLLQVE